MIVVTSMDKLPHSCMSCPFQKNQKTPFCRAKRNWYRPFEDVPSSFGLYIKEWDFSEGQTPWSARAKWCPLVEVPDRKDEPKRGEWIVHKERTVANDGFIDFFPTEYECSNCGLKQSMYFINSKPSNFCPNCGADMREESE